MKPLDYLIEALNDGHYNQTTGRLRSWGGWSAAGILCELYREHTGDGVWIAMHGRNYSPWFFTTGDGERQYAMTLPPYVADWAGLSDKGVQFIERAESLPASFAQQARMIEKFRDQYEA